MPETPVNPDLLKALVGRHIQPRPATGNPSIERAMNGMPQDLAAGVEAKPFWTPEVFSNILGRTPILDPTNIMVNGLHAALGPQGQIDATVRHELEHTKQFRENPAPSDPTAIAEWVKKMDYNRSYDERKPEIEAEDAAMKWMKTRKHGTHEGTNRQVSAGFFNDVHDSPAVKALLNRLNGK